MARLMTDEELADYIRVELDMASHFDEIGRNDLAMACLNAAEVAKVLLAGEAFAAETFGEVARS